MKNREELAVFIGLARRHEPYPAPLDYEIADSLLHVGWCQPVADPETVERVAEAIRGETCCACGDVEAARAAISAIGGSNG